MIIYTVSASKKNNKLRIIFSALIVLTTVVAYYSSLNNGFVFDDVFNLQENPYVRNLNNIPSFFMSSKTQASYDMKIYRPLRQVMYAGEYQLYGLNPFGYHLVNVIIHIGNALLLFLFFDLLGINFFAAAMMSALFAIHPLNTEAVSNITGRADVLFLMFYVSGLISFIKSQESRNKVYFYSTVVFYALALFSKEMAITFPVVVLLVDLLMKTRSPSSMKKNLKLYVLLVIVSGIYLLLRTYAIGNLGRGEYYGDSLLITMMTQSAIILKYIKLFFIPHPLTVRYNPFLIETPYNPYPIVFLLLVISMAAAIIHSIRKRTVPLWLFGVLWFVITLLPVSNIIPIRAAMMGERYMYLPIVGLLIAVFHASSLLVTGRKVPLWSFMAIYAAALCIFVSLTISRNFVWKDNITLFEDAKPKAPDSLVVHWTLFQEYDRRGEKDKALAEFREMKRINQKAANKYLSIAEKYKAENRLEDARRMAEKALSTKPDFKEAMLFINSIQ